MDIKVTPSSVFGKVTAPASKSVAHRLLIAAYLSGSRVKIKNIGASVDVDVTLTALERFGAKVEKFDGGVIIEHCNYRLSD